MSEQTEKRKYQRVFFAPENRLSAVFEQSGITAEILDMSPGGMGVSVKRTSGLQLGKDERIHLSKITGEDGLEITAGFKIEIRWIMDQAGFEHVAFGCQFLDSPQPFVEAIGALLERCLAESAV